jgi:hypothetical protein
MKTLCILGFAVLASLPVSSQGLSSSFVTGMTVVGGDGPFDVSPLDSKTESKNSR